MSNGVDLKSAFRGLQEAMTPRVETPKRPDVQTARRLNVATAERPASQAPAAKAKRKVAISADPDFEKLTVYVRAETKTRVGMRLMQERREYSELIEALLDGWVTRRLDA